MLTATFSSLAAYSFLAFNLLCAPCFAAIGAMHRELMTARWTWFGVGYQCVYAYVVALIIYQVGLLFTGGGFGIGTICALACLAGMIYLLFRKPYADRRPRMATGQVGA